ncbi:hypothetical protein ITP53_14605 [Nonomuraea sp. K274]|uniref:Secreted protein n=1 Tax=Nonomuraea cypriaca TaxID=1187855 RepID=A0A931EWQ2_9ACTN|nr:hypothetical protein [Nonomuraea cypriaca]MBF8186949.1 hypothetical protein [Nonomuraea cypriaca]
MLKRLIPVLLTLAVVLVWAAPAQAHGRSGASDVRFAQTIAGMELTVVIRASLRVPSPLQVDVVAHDPGLGGRVGLTLRSTRSGAASSGAALVEKGRPGMYPVVLAADRVGPHELVVRAGAERSVLPFDLLTPGAPLWEVVVYAAFACAAVGLIGALAGAALSRREVAGGFTVVFVVATVVAFTAGGLSPWFAPPVPDGATPVPAQERLLGKPNAQPLIEVEPERPGAYTEFRLRVALFDGSTGRPADDLAEHHAALAHVVVTSQDGTYFRHVHPARTAPGVYEVRLRAGGSGRQLVYAEFERWDAGGQLVSGAFTVGSGDREGKSASQATRSGEPVVEPARPVAGRPMTLTLDTGAGALQPWLGMAGHLIVRSQDGGYLGHVHEDNSMGTGTEQVPDESVARYGPQLRFSLSFPRPGRYLAWIQFSRNYAIVTVPQVIEVAAEGSP